MIYRLIPPKWLDKSKNPVLEGEFTDDEINALNAQGYGVYYFPNYPSEYQPGSHISGRDITNFEWVFIDFDLKDNKYPSKEAFYEYISEQGTILDPTQIVDSGNGAHVYWAVSNLDAKSYLRFQRRLMRLFDTDPATTMLVQLLRKPGTFNTKDKEKFLPCEVVYTSNAIYTPDELDKLLPPITREDEEFCKTHYDRTFNINQEVISDTLPPKFGKFLTDNPEAKELFAGQSDDRSKADYRLGHLMFANGFTREEALSVLVNTIKALDRAPIHRSSYAQNIVDKIWTYEIESKVTLSKSIKDILQKTNGLPSGVPFRCHPRIDNTVRGYCLGDVIGLVGGSGIGKTAFGLNMFRWFSQRNPDYHHFFVALEQPENEIADRWLSMASGDTSLNEKVHVVSNYDVEGNYRNLSLDEIQTYILEWEKDTGNKVGCVMIDHIGALAKKGADDEQQDLMYICHKMKAFAVQTKTLLVMQSQTSREKAGIGDLELNKDAAFGTSTFEWYCDYLITLWQPLKRCHNEPACPTITAFKFCKIRHKRTKKDVIQEDVPYYMYFDSDTEQLRDVTQDEKTSFKYFITQATNKRKADRKTEILEYNSVPWEENEATSNQRT